MICERPPLEGTREDNRWIMARQMCIRNHMRPHAHAVLQQSPEDNQCTAGTQQPLRTTATADCCSPLPLDRFLQRDTYLCTIPRLYTCSDGGRPHGCSQWAGADAVTRGTWKGHHLPRVGSSSCSFSFPFPLPSFLSLSLPFSYVILPSFPVTHTATTTAARWP